MNIEKENILYRTAIQGLMDKFKLLKKLFGALVARQQTNPKNYSYEASDEKEVVTFCLLQNKNCLWIYLWSRYNYLFRVIYDFYCELHVRMFAGYIQM